ncbi:hypothetical protein N5D52_20840 [Pseudomonas sp. GD03860]|uniref:hypothetical protein n=1 Tax=Pseudomonas sp. GD03860 TaxID=2975389 RepID=UPI00244BDEEB|nr:hypothetical protein [Pseudomonas sp. GD03860]MDH0639382.1 hypothetical protein [Pseudomonas sp. GD03860]
MPKCSNPAKTQARKIDQSNHPRNGIFMKTLSVKHLADKIFSLAEDTQEIYEEVISNSKVPFDSQDARLVALVGIKLDLLACAHTLSLSNNSKIKLQEESPENWELEYCKLVESNQTAKNAHETIETYFKNTLIVSIHFKIDSLFKNLLKSLDEDKGNNFHESAKKLLAKCGTENTEHFLNCLSALTYIRNSLHANGVHHGKPLRLEIDGFEYVFLDNSVVTCAGWAHIEAITIANLKNIRALLNSSSLSSISQPIRDEFSFGREYH